MRSLIRIGLLGLAITFGGMSLIPSPAWALERVQLSVFLVKVVEGREKRSGQLPVTIYLDLKDREEAAYVCGIAPRVRDALLQHLNKETFYLNNKEKLNINKLRLDLWPIAYKAIPNVKLQNMLVVQGEGKVGSSEARMFARKGCRHVSG